MTEASAPLNSAGFGDEALQEGDAWLWDALQAVKSVLPIKLRAGLIGGGAPNPYYADVEGAVRQFLHALRHGTLLAFVRHPQSGAVSPIEARRWEFFAASLIVEHKSVPAHLWEDFGAFVNRRLRIDGEAFLEWLWSEYRKRGGIPRRRTLPGFEHLTVAKTIQRQRVQSAARHHNSPTVPEGYTSIGRLFDSGFRLLFPEAFSRPWLSNQPRSIALDPPAPAQELLEEWRTRLSRSYLLGPPVVPSIDARHWHIRLAMDVARRLTRATKSTGSRVLYWSKGDGKAFDAPERLLDPNRSFLQHGSPWVAGLADTLLTDANLDAYNGAALFVSEADYAAIWDAFIEGAKEAIPKAVLAPEKPQRPKRRKGRPEGSGGFRMADVPLVKEMKTFVEKGYSVRGAAIEVVAQAKGGGGDESKIRRLTKRYEETDGL